MTRRAPLVLTLFLAAVPARSQSAPDVSSEAMSELSAARTNPRWFTVDENSVRIERAEPAKRPAKAEPRPAKAEPRDEAGGDGNPLPVLDAIINTGTKLWKIVLENKPVVDVRATYATALPKGAAGWTQMTGWQAPEGKVYALTAKNSLGATVINVRYQVLRTYGGSYQGKGKYLTAVTVEPLLVEVAWGYRFSMEASVPDSSVVNVGTAEDPVAAMMPQLGWRISTPLKDSSGQSLYFLRGDGAFLEIGGPFSRLLGVDMPREEALP